MGRTGEAFAEWLTEPSTVVSAVLLVMGLLFVGMESQSQNWVYYTGEHTTGTVRGGIVYYQVGGETYTQDDPHASPSSSGEKVTVYYRAGDPATAELDQPVRWIEGAAMAVWFAAAAILLLVSAARRRRAERHRPPQPEGRHWW
ncbi:MAG TPA: hypothetical protein VI452_10680 [Marmoricola sp.]|jgi:hypothetical protein